MKHYTYQEHHVFCIESGIPGVKVWREVAKLGWMPEGIYHDPDQSFNPERKARRKKRQLTPEHKARRKEYAKKYHSTPEYKAKKKEWDRKYRSTPEYSAKKKEYDKRRRNKK